jgi:transcriptional regulator with XRE-family HTH domain
LKLRAAGLSLAQIGKRLALAALEKRCGVGRMLLSSYECGRSEPGLTRVLGVEWLAVE